MEELIKAGWLRTTHRDLPCVEKTYTWLGVYGDFRIYEDGSGVVHVTINKKLVASVRISISHISFVDIENSCIDIIRQAYAKYLGV